MALNFGDYGSRPDCTAALRSLWQGKVILQGRDWQVGIVQNVEDKPGSPDRGRQKQSKYLSFSEKGVAPTQQHNGVHYHSNLIQGLLAVIITTSGDVKQGNSV